MPAIPSTPSDNPQPTPDRRLTGRHRGLLATTAVGAIVLLLGATAGFLWLEREQVLDESAELAARGAHRLATDLEQSLTVARTAIDQFNRQLPLTAAQPFQTPPNARAQSHAELLAALPLPFALHAVGPQDLEIALIGSATHVEPGQTRAPRLLTDVPSHRWDIGNTTGLPDKGVIPLFWRAEPNAQGISGYGVDLTFDALQGWLESERRNPADRVSLFRLNTNGSATLLAAAPRFDAQFGSAVTAAWVARAEQAPAGTVDLVGHYDGVPRRVAYQRLSGAADRLVLVYGASTETALAAWSARLPYWVGLALLLAAGMGLGGWRLHRSLRALTNSERRFQLVLDSGNVWDWDLATGSVRYAPVFLHNLGLPAVPPEDMAQAFYTMMAPEDVPRVKNALREHVIHGTPYDISFRLRDVQGRLRWFESQGRAFRDAHGRATYMAGTTFEVTERRALAESQRQTVQRLDTVANASPVLFWTADLQGQIEWVNRRWLDFTGRTEGDKPGEGWMQGIHPEDAAQRRMAMDGALVNRQPFALEYRLRHHSGGYRWLMEQCLPRLDADQQTVGFIGSCVDINELKRTEDVVRERGAMLDGVFEVLQDRLFVIDDHNRFVHYQGVQDRSLYASPDLFLGKTVSAMFTTDLAARFERELQRARTGQLCDFDYMLDLPGIGPRHFNARMARIADSKHCMVLVHDSTEREMLRQQQERLHRFMQLQARLASSFINLPIERIGDGIDQALADIGSFVGADRAYLFIYDLPAHTASNTHEWCAPGIEPAKDQLQSLSMRLIPDWVAAHEQKQAFRVDDVKQLPASSLREILEPQGICSLITLPMHSSAGLLGFVGFDAVRSTRVYDHDEVRLLHLFAQMLVNLHERQRTEAQLRELTTELEQRVAERTQQLDFSVRRLSQANRELESFAYSVSHDLKSPLRSVEGFASLLLHEQSDALNDEARDYLQRIQRATLHMARLINDLLAYCRIEELGRGLVPLPLADAVGEVLEGMRNELDARQAVVRLHIPPALAALSHPQGMAMVLRNLVDNAMKFTRPGQVPEISIEGCAVGPLVRLSVRDRGMGFDMKHHDRIFAIFQRLHRPDQIAGTGIGLAMVHKAVERMEGRIWAHSTPGEGATFTIELPLA